MPISRLLWAFVLCCATAAVPAQRMDALVAQPATIQGTVTDIQGAVVPGAAVTLDGPAQNAKKSLTTNGAGYFQFKGLAPAVSYIIHIHANGFAERALPAIVLRPAQALDLANIELTISVVETTVAALTVEQLATQQVRVEEKQRVLGIIPNFYVAYDKHAVPLTKKLKYELALKATTDIVNIGADFVLAGINQAADTPDFQQGAKGYAQRFGAAYAQGSTDIVIGGAVLPALLHQDPRYFYQGSGTNKARALHAIASPFVCRGDNYRSQFNASSIGGDLISASLTNIYLPPSNRGAGLVFSSALISTSGRIVNALVQEFILRKYTTNAK